MESKCSSDKHIRYNYKLAVLHANKYSILFEFNAPCEVVAIKEKKIDLLIALKLFSQSIKSKKDNSCCTQH